MLVATQALLAIATSTFAGSPVTVQVPPKINLNEWTSFTIRTSSPAVWGRTKIGGFAWIRYEGRFQYSLSRRKFEKTVSFQGVRRTGQLTGDGQFRCHHSNRAANGLGGYINITLDGHGRPSSGRVPFAFN